MRSTEVVLEQYRALGWTTTPVLFDAELMAAARERTVAVCEGEYATGRAPHVVYPVEDPRSLRKIDNAWWSDTVLASVATSPAIGQFAAELAGADEIYLWHDQLLWKPPGGEALGNVGWHQDKGYWTASSSSEMLTFWVAFDDVDESMGALRFVDGSHRWGRVISGNAFFETDLDGQRREASLPDGANWSESLAELSAGQASVHHCKTIHGSGPNRSERHRFSMAVHLMPGDAVVVADRHHPNLELFDAAPGAPFRGEAFPRVWPPA